MPLLFFYGGVIGFLLCFRARQADGQGSFPELVCPTGSNSNVQSLAFCGVSSAQRLDYSVPANLELLRHLILHSSLDTRSFGRCYNSLHNHLSSSQVSERMQRALQNVSEGFFHTSSSLNRGIRMLDFPLESCEDNETSVGNTTYRVCALLNRIVEHVERLTAMEDFFRQGKVPLSLAVGILDKVDTLLQVIDELKAPDRQTRNVISVSQISSEQNSSPVPTQHIYEYIRSRSTTLMKARLGMSLYLKAAFSACLGNFVSPWQEVLQLATQYRAFLPKHDDLKGGLIKNISFLICNIVVPPSNNSTAIERHLTCLWPACKKACHLIEELTANPLLRSHLKDRFNIVWTSAQALKKTCTLSNVCVQPELVRGLVRQRLWTNKTSSSTDKDQPMHLCRGPLKWTDNPGHRLQTRSVYPRIRSQLQKHLGTSVNITNELLDSLLQCGLSCEGDFYNFSASEIDWLTAFVGLTGWAITMFSFFACLTFLIHFRSMQGLPKQLVFSVNLGFLLFGISYVPAPFKSNNLACHDDGTTRLREPSSSTACTTVAVFFFIGFSHLSMMCACFSHALWEVIRQLQTVKGKRSVARKTREDRLRLLIYTALSLALIVPSLSVALAGKKFAGIPLIRTCGIQMDPMLYHLTVPAIVAFAVALFFLVLGIWKLVMIKRLSNQIAQKMQRGGTGNKKGSDTQSAQGIQKIIRRMIIQLLGIMFATAGIVGWGTTMRRFVHIWEDGIVDNVKCRVLNGDSSSLCVPVKFPLSLVEFILLILIPGSSAIILSSWAISSEYWPCLKRLSNLRERLFKNSLKGKKSSTNGMTETSKLTPAREEHELGDERSPSTTKADLPQGQLSQTATNKFQQTSTFEQERTINESV